MLEKTYQALKNFNSVMEVRKYTAIDKTGVTYIDKEGRTQRIIADLLVLATGGVGKYDEAQLLYGAGKVTYFIGDCNRVADVHKAVVGGFAAASQI